MLEDKTILLSNMKQYNNININSSTVALLKLLRCKVLLLWYAPHCYIENPKTLLVSKSTFEWTLCMHTSQSLPGAER